MSGTSPRPPGHRGLRGLSRGQGHRSCEPQGLLRAQRGLLSSLGRACLSGSAENSLPQRCPDTYSHELLSLAAADAAKTSRAAVGSISTTVLPGGPEAQ